MDRRNDAGAVERGEQIVVDRRLVDAADIGRDELGTLGRLGRIPRDLARRVRYAATRLARTDNGCT